MLHERRKFKRLDVIHLIEIKLLDRTRANLLGLTRNFSCEGLSFELLNTDFALTERIEFNLKYPQRNLYVSFLGDAVWKKRVDNKLLAGIKIREMDKENNNKLMEMISTISNLSVDLIGCGKNDESDRREKEKVKSAANLSVKEKENVVVKPFRKDKRKKTWLYLPAVTVIAVVSVFIIYKLFIHSQRISKHPAPDIEMKRKIYSPKLKPYHVTRDNNKNSSRTIYIIQTGSFTDIANADKQFESIIQRLKREAIDDLRIEKVGKYNAVRFGEFEDYASADKFLKTVTPEFSTAIILKADINDEKIMRLYDEK